MPPDRTWRSLTERKCHYTHIDEQILQLHTERNTLAPINCISQGVLASIFIYISPLRSPTEYDLFSVTHVCQHWRTVALSFPYLWSRVPMHPWSSPPLVRMMLDRAKGVVLDIGIDAMADGSTLKEWRGDWELVEELCREAHPSREMHLNLIGGRMRRVLLHTSRRQTHYFWSVSICT
ncbi:hypothetical protein CONPUDRAFT_160618 [Coniophora puteana RWD-64-598 SS2]|uniref:Uncharacterized protein n=1 Tax=Coniophora puteana (strain RWD-64-598) TaxID=741705 RepID=R7SCG8_CONPW|nr:uncharacterized protein CONPUDRAFT_160618 [Coniophora puteana RWD-64-598 SS2]EIW73866.1 hypothetical protein CONPUDRAFT_160618 [Coniophora puteana RWD-64-598 SS2]